MAKSITVNTARAYLDLPEKRDVYCMTTTDYIKLVLGMQNNSLPLLGMQARKDHIEASESLDAMRTKAKRYTHYNTQRALQAQMARRNTAAAERAIRLAIVNA